MSPKLPAESFRYWTTACISSSQGLARRPCAYASASASCMLSYLCGLVLAAYLVNYRNDEHCGLSLSGSASERL